MRRGGRGALCVYALAGEAILPGCWVTVYEGSEYRALPCNRSSLVMSVRLNPCVWVCQSELCGICLCVQRWQGGCRGPDAARTHTMSRKPHTSHFFLATLSAGFKICTHTTQPHRNEPHGVHTLEASKQVFHRYTLGHMPRLSNAGIHTTPAYTQRWHTYNGKEAASKAARASSTNITQLGQGQAHVKTRNRTTKPQNVLCMCVCAASPGRST